MEAALPRPCEPRGVQPNFLAPVLSPLGTCVYVFEHHSDHDTFSGVVGLGEGQVDS